MVVHKRKKVTKYRAHTTHGGGHRKKRRGAGSRGGRGRAGGGKRAGQKKAGGVIVIKGKKGFNPRRLVTKKAINLGYFTLNKVEKLVSANKGQKEGDFYVFDFKKLGYNKLLGTGKSEVKLKLAVSNYTAKAAEKLKAAGGEIIPITVNKKSKSDKNTKSVLTEEKKVNKENSNKKSSDK